MKFFVVFAAVLATVTSASPADATIAARAVDQSPMLKYLLTNIPSFNVAGDGPAPPGCYWDGTAPYCAGSCPDGYTEEDRGSCGDGACCWTGYKYLCCNNQ